MKVSEGVWPVGARGRSVQAGYSQRRRSTQDRALQAEGPLEVDLPHCLSDTEEVTGSGPVQPTSNTAGHTGATKARTHPVPSRSMSVTRCHGLRGIRLFFAFAACGSPTRGEAVVAAACDVHRIVAQPWEDDRPPGKG